MADLKFGNVTPAVGNIKLGSNNVSEIYQGATKLWPLGSAPQPGEVTVCDLIWTKTNSTITATTTGGNIPIVTNQNDWITKCQNNDPAACYWQFDSNNAFRGLYYNVFAAEVIQPPTGFRVPTQQDWQDLIDCAEIGGSTGNDVTSLGNNYYGFWPSNVASNSRFGTVDFNSIGAGYTWTGQLSVPPQAPQGWFSQGVRDIYHQKQTWPSLPASYYPITMVWHRNYNPTDVLVGYATASFNDGFATGKNGGAFIRFVKDVPVVTNTGIYGNFTGLPDDTQSGTPNIYTQTSQTYFNTSNNQQNRVATSIITSSTYDEFRFKAKVNSGSFTMNSVQIFAYSDSARTNLVAQTSPWTGPLAMTSSYQDPWGSLTLSTPGTYFLKVSFNLTSSGQQGYQLTLT